MLMAIRLRRKHSKEVFNNREHPATGVFFFAWTGTEFEFRVHMSLGPDLVKKISLKYEPSAMVPIRFRNYDILLRTDEKGNAVQLFIGKATEDGRIKGERYARIMKFDNEGKLIKDHWDRKGKTY
jgi:hypothetical protein